MILYRLHHKPTLVRQSMKIRMNWTSVFSPILRLILHDPKPGDQTQDLLFSRQESDIEATESTDIGLN